MSYTEATGTHRRPEQAFGYGRVRFPINPIFVQSGASVAFWEGKQ